MLKAIIIITYIYIYLSSYKYQYHNLRANYMLRYITLIYS